MGKSFRYKDFCNHSGRQALVMICWRYPREPLANRSTKTIQPRRHPRLVYTVLKEHSFSSFYRQFNRLFWCFLKLEGYLTDLTCRKVVKPKQRLKNTETARMRCIFAYFHWRTRAHFIIFYSVSNVYLLKDILTKVDQFFGHLGKVMIFTCKIVNKRSTGWNTIKVSLYKLVLLTN